MTTVTTTKVEKVAESTARAGWLVRISVFLIVVAWTIPSMGLLVGSFRGSADASSSGWWTSLFQPFATDWTIGNYQNVLSRGGMFEAFINSLIVTLPATVIPITLAAFAAYAFAWTKFRGRGLLVRHRRRSAGGAAPDVARPAA